MILGKGSTKRSTDDQTTDTEVQKKPVRDTENRETLHDL